MSLKQSKANSPTGSDRTKPSVVYAQIFKTLRLTLLVRGQAEAAPVEYISGNFLSSLGIIPAAGRLIDDRDNTAGASQVAVLSYNYWRDRFAGDFGAIGQTVSINNVPFTIAGVAAPEFFGVAPGSPPAVYIPIVNRPAVARNYGNEHDTMFIDPHFYWVDIIGRLRPGVKLASVQAEVAARFHQFALASAANDNERASLPALWLEEGGSGMDSLRRQYSKPLFVLMTMVAFILAIACSGRCSSSSPPRRTGPPRPRGAGSHHRRPAHRGRRRRRRRRRGARRAR